MTWLLVFLVIGATYRLTRLVTADFITKPFRLWINQKYGDNKMSYLVTCDWCVSFWMAWAPAALAIWFPTNRAIWLILLALTASAFTGLAATRLEAE